MSLDGTRHSPMPPSRIRLCAANIQATQPRTLDSDTSGSLRRPPIVLTQPKTLFDAFANLWAHRTAVSACCTSVDGAAPSLGVAGHVGPDAGLLQRRDDILHVVAFVRAERRRALLPHR